ncbi:MULTISPECIES: chemotaxis protein CheD [Pseudobutyrivibrio]|uniref:Probable chemoreceptor glutamine deamidase CheD n=1 Tax=Pseudobutyrivibrio xylanivorans TaxID=185007 RepID=A0A1G5RX50_PSEXY|nr:MULTISPECIES: chemotaxis protein CheD [Pseudobutyrivibrio]MDC7278223.1 chemotaxis protein CheD [Butyrivibrio fibrisolvens]SCZ78438.1 chemotaxis protein CheD [Pseudobutyrivibrio xylanivorans]
MGQMIKVGMADLKICKAPDALTTIGLGSCIGIAIYDPSTKISGLAHIMLPDSTAIRNNSNIAKFADTGIQKLYDDMIKAGANKARMVAKIAGGAKMFEMPGASTSINVGDRNAEASRQKLKQLGIKIIAEDCGLNYGRTVELYSETGEYYIKAVGKELKII